MTSLIMSAFLSVVALPPTNLPPSEEIVQAQTPDFLYKILSLENWNASQQKEALVLSKDDEAFIHFSQEDQLDRIASKYWTNVPEYVVLKVNTSKVTGKLVYENNPGSTNKYYHLYEGSIPTDAVVDSQLVKN